MSHVTVLAAYLQRICQHRGEVTGETLVRVCHWPVLTVGQLKLCEEPSELLRVKCLLVLATPAGLVVDSDAIEEKLAPLKSMATRPRGRGQQHPLPAYDREVLELMEETGLLGGVLTKCALETWSVGIH